ncbi:MAG: stress response protein [bacterium]|nr:stress response protein [bacterium]
MTSHYRLGGDLMTGRKFMTDETPWQTARLIPVSGIRGAEEQERRATSALLAVLGSVEEFGEGFTRQFGANKGRVETFIEVPFEFEGKNVIPDGLIRVSRGKRTWVALVEVKTGASDLTREQVENYLDVAREEEYDAVITISNQIARIPGEHPLTVDRRKLRKVGLHHISWSKVLTQAVMVRSHTGVADPDQAWILGELIRYLEHPKAGAMDFGDMGEHWVPIRKAASAGTLRVTDKSAAEVASRWEELVSFVALRLGRELGADVQQVLTRKERSEPETRISSLVTAMGSEGQLNGRIRIPNTIADLEVVADLRAQQVRVSISLDAPGEGRPKTRLNWLLRQLSDAPKDLRLDAFAVRSRTSMSELLADAREEPERLLPQDGRELGSFTVSLIRPMGLGRSAAKKKSFISSVLNAIDEFYETVVQDLQAWKPKAPRLERPKQAPETPTAQPQVESTPAPTVVWPTYPAQ